MKGMKWERAKKGKPGRNIRDEVEYRAKDAAARWLDKYDTREKKRRSRKAENRSTDTRETIGAKFEEIESVGPPWDE